MLKDSERNEFYNKCAAHHSNHTYIEEYLSTSTFLYLEELLIVCAENGWIEIYCLVKNKLKIKINCALFRILLQSCLAHNKVAMSKFLLEEIKRIFPEQYRSISNDYLCESARCGSNEILVLLLQEGANINHNRTIFADYFYNEDCTRDHKIMITRTLLKWCKVSDHQYFNQQILKDALHPEYHIKNAISACALLDDGRQEENIC